VIAHELSCWMSLGNRRVRESCKVAVLNPDVHIGESRYLIRHSPVEGGTIVQLSGTIETLRISRGIYLITDFIL
jgi:hypothetical protein